MTSALTKILVSISFKTTSTFIKDYLEWIDSSTVCIQSHFNWIVHFLVFQIRHKTPPAAPMRNSRSLSTPSSNLLNPIQMKSQIPQPSSAMMIPVFHLFHHCCLPLTRHQNQVPCPSVGPSLLISLRHQLLLATIHSSRTCVMFWSPSANRWAIPLSSSVPWFQPTRLRSLSEKRLYKIGKSIIKVYCRISSHLKQHLMNRLIFLLHSISSLSLFVFQIPTTRKVLSRSSTWTFHIVPFSCCQHWDGENGNDERQHPDNTLQGLVMSTFWYPNPSGK